MGFRFGLSLDPGFAVHELTFGGMGAGEVLCDPIAHVSDFDALEGGVHFLDIGRPQQDGIGQQQTGEAALGVLLLQLLVESETGFQNLRAHRQVLAGPELLFCFVQKLHHGLDQLLTETMPPEMGDAALELPGRATEDPLLVEQREGDGHDFLTRLPSADAWSKVTQPTQLFLQAARADVLAAFRFRMIQMPQHGGRPV